MIRIVASMSEANRKSKTEPLIQALIVAISKHVHWLEKLEIRNNKELTIVEREEFYKKIKDYSVKNRTTFHIAYIVTPIEKINTTNINLLKIMNVKKFIEMYPDINILYMNPIGNQSRDNVIAKIRKTEYRGKLPRIIYEVDADRKYAIVSAASIIAEMTRDKIVERLTNLTK